MSGPPIADVDALRGALGTRYALERELGRGGMGAVYLARDRRLDRPVALKVLPPEFATQSALRERFLLETRTAAGFSHPNIVPVYAVEETDDLLAYAMGFVEGETLADRVRRTGPLTARELVRLLQDVGYALAYAHGRGVVHRDIKPENIMLERATGRALVMDFGIARAIASPGDARGLTRVGEVVGTPEYMSPEQAAGDLVDGRSDLYALGLAAHFAATGRTAITGESTQRILVRQLTEPVPSILLARSDLPTPLGEAIDRCVEKEPAARFPTAEALVEAIDLAQLAEPEIPLPIRLFANELGTLSLLALGVFSFAWYFVANAREHDATLLDTVIPLIGILAVIATRALTSVAEARRLATIGYEWNEVSEGLGRVVDERARQRDALRADVNARQRRRRTIAWGAGLLVGGVAMIKYAMAHRIPQPGGGYGNSPFNVLLVSLGIAMTGASVVLLLKSPLRMPIGERMFRLVWLGPLGRGFLWLATRGVPPGPAGVTLPPTRHPTLRPTNPSTLPAPAAAPTVTRAPVTEDRIGALEARVSALEGKLLRSE